MRFSLNKTFLLILVCGLFSGTLFANGGEISLNDHAFRLAGDMDIGNNGLELEGSVLHHEERGNVAGLAGMKFGNAGSEGLDAGIGLKLTYSDPDIEIASPCQVPPCATTNVSGGVALALGGKVRYVPAVYDRLNFGAYAWYAPGVLAFDKLEKYQEVGVYAGYNVIRDADVFVGYRNVKSDFKSYGDITLDTGFHFGIRVTF